MNRRVVMLSLLLLVGSATTANHLSHLRSSDASLSRSLDDEAQITLAVSGITQSIQQLAASVELDSTTLAAAFPVVGSITPTQLLRIDSLLEVAATLAPTIEAGHRDWYSTAFDFFRFQLDSIRVVDSTATAFLHRDWIRNEGRNPSLGLDSLSLVKSAFSWHLTDLEQLIAAMSNYLQVNETLLKEYSRDRDLYSKSSWDDYNEWLSNTAVHLLLERDVYPPDFPRFTKSAALDELGHKLFQCAGIPSSYYYENDPLIGHPVSVAAVSDHCWQRFVVADLVDENDSYLFARGRSGSAANLDEFAGPGGLEFRAHDYLYICDRGNDRIKKILISPSNHQPTLSGITTGISEPADLDLTRDGHVIVAEYGADAIYAYCENLGCTSRRWTYMNSSLGSIDRPVAVAFARNEQSSEKRITSAYFIDKDGHRLVKITEPFSPVAGFGPSFISPDPITLMTDVAVDNRGQVWVVDQEKSKIHKFDKNLKLLAIHGGEGDGYAKYNAPYGLSFSQAYHWNPGTQSAEPIPEMAEAILTERWDATTGVRRLVSGVDIQSFATKYRPRLQSGAGDMIHGSLFITDFAEYQLDFRCNAVVLHTIAQPVQLPGLVYYSWLLPAGAPSGDYEVSLTVTSLNQNANSVEQTQTVVVNRSLVNQPPVVTNIWFPDGDSCFIMDVPKWIRATAYDPDGSISTYQWQVTRSGTGDVYSIQGDSLYFQSHFSSAKIPDDHSFLRVWAVDDLDELSATYYDINFSRLTVYYDYDCICTWMPGDANFSHSYSISDIVHITNFVFSGGPAPQPVHLAGDADCSQAVSISDAVFLTNYIFAGGPPVQCTCSDY